MVLLLSRSDIRSVVTINEIIDVVEKGFVEYSLGNVEMPPRIILSPCGGWVGVMPSHMKNSSALATKIVSVFKNNVKINLPSTIAILVYSDPSTGLPLAIMEGTYLTALRTGGASGVATKYLSLEDSKKLAIIGCGSQAGAQIEAINAVREIEEVCVF